MSQQKEIPKKTVSTTEKKDDKTKIQVSSQKQSLSFYVFLAKKFLQSEETVELSGLGNAINTVVSCAEILKTTGFAVVKKIETSSVQMPSQKESDKTISKAKIQIFVSKATNFEKLMEKEKKEQEERKAKKEQEHDTKK
jgi:DNA-binding protein